MTELADLPETALNRFPLSGTQQWLCAGDLGDQAGTFGPLFTADIAVRISGRVDVAALRCALDDIVRRHEILRTIVARDARPRYQQVYPPAPATLHVRDVPPVSEKSRDVRVKEIIIAAARRPIDVRTLPLLRAELHRFDDQDSVLVVCSHHTAADGWSMNVIIRDLAVFYKARATGCPVDMPDAPQYRDFVAWEQARFTGPDADVALRYWREKMSGARIFALPTDHPVSGIYSRPYSAYYFSIDPGVTAEAVTLSIAMRSSIFMISLAAFNVLTYEITGSTDTVVTSFSSGRNDPKSHDIVGPTANALPLRTNIDGCITFRDVVACTRRTCLEAYSHEIPTEYIEREAPNLMEPLNDPMRCNFFAFSMPQPHIDDAELEFADSSYEVREEVVEEEPVSTDLGGGVVWDMDLLRSGELTGTIRFNLDEFNEDTVIGWVSAYRRILSSGVLDPDGEWKKLQVAPV
jgi:condensation enzyme